MMAGTSDRLRQAADQAAQQQQGGNAPAVREGERPPTIRQLIDRQRTEIVRALPRHMSPDRLARTVVTVVKGNPKLLEADPQSLLAALMLSAQLGLEPGPLGHCYFVPFKNNKARWKDDRGRTITGPRQEVQWILGYKGIIHLAMQSGMLASIEARAVYANDEFEFEYGLNERLRHVPADGDRGELVRFYGIARFKDGGRYFTVMSKSDVDKHRARSRAKDDGPWVDFYEQMGCKTVIRTMQPFLPMSVERVGLAMALDERPQQGVDVLNDANLDDSDTGALAIASGGGSTPDEGAPDEGDEGAADGRTITPDGDAVDEGTGETDPLPDEPPLPEGEPGYVWPPTRGPGRGTDD